MLNCKEIFDLLLQSGTYWYTGVPDSLLKSFCAYVQDHGNNIIAANEGGSLGIAAGYHLATGKIPAVYMQNSGFGNIINPLTSLADAEVYNIPMLLIIGWRGEPGKKDEPQHIKQGRISESLLQSLEIPYAVLSDEIGTAKQQIDIAYEHLSKSGSPYALLVPKNTFGPYQLEEQETSSKYSLQREQAIKIILEHLEERDIVVSTTGMTSREVYEHRKATTQKYDSDFLTVGSMGHASQIALGIALEKPDRKVICIDGDGATLMHMGSLAIIGDKKPKNLKHIVINNGSHDSVGGQPTVGFDIDFEGIYNSCGYEQTYRVQGQSDLTSILPTFLSAKGLAMLEIRVAKGARKDLGRPHMKPKENKQAFMNNLSK